MMRQLPFKNELFHFIGIGGIGMSGIAQLLHQMECRVRGSDISDNANVQRLRALGIEIDIGHEASHVEGATLAVYSAAIGDDNAEMQRAKDLRIPLVSRAAMLAELMRVKRAIAVAGSHGKTTTTSLLAHILEEGGISPTVVGGGVIEAWGSNVRLGTGEFLLAETDESDGSFTRYHPEIAIVTNIDEEHISHYGDFAALRRAFDDFIATIPFYGCAILNVDASHVQDMLTRLNHRVAVRTYGFAAQADVRAVNVKAKGMGMQCDVLLRDGIMAAKQNSFAVTLPMVGRHNLSNALAAIAASLRVGIAVDVIQRALASFAGVRRRFQIMGMTTRGAIIINDYAHHPTEIEATLKAARQHYGARHIVAVHQPHRYSRLSDLFDQFCCAFNDADRVLISDVYGAGEEPLSGYDAAHLVQQLRASGHQSAHHLQNSDELAATLAAMDNVKMQDAVIICMGAGSIGGWSEKLTSQLNELDEKRGVS